MSPDIQDAFEKLHGFMFDIVYSNSYAKHEEKKVPQLIELLYTYFKKHKGLLPKENMLTAEKEGIDRAVCDYISGMTDHFATETFKNIFIPYAWQFAPTNKRRGKNADT